MIHSKELIIGNQRAWLHDEGYSAGYFHTFDHFQTKGERYAERKLQVFLPRDYEKSNSSYPVLYMNDGDTTFFKGGLVNQSWNLGTTLSNLYTNHVIRPLIIVAIWPVNRNSEYTHARWYNDDCCELELYASTVSRCIKPFIDSYYHTISDPKNTMILGSSHGGLVAFYIANSYPKLFGFSGIMSPSFWVGLDNATEFPIVTPCPDKALNNSQLIALVQRTLINPKLRPKLYIDWGLIRNGGPHNKFIEERATVRGREMVELLQKEYGYQIVKDLIFYEDPKGEHNEQSWGRRMPRILEWFAKDQHSIVSTLNK